MKADNFNLVEYLSKNILLENELSPKELDIVDDILSVNEGFEDIMNKIKSYAKKGLLTITILITVINQLNASGQTDIANQVKQVTQQEIASFAPDVVFKSGDFDVFDAYRAAQIYGVDLALSLWENYEGYLITSDGKINGHDLGSLSNILQFFQDVKNNTSTEKYTVSSAGFGSKKVVFKGGTKEYYITPYLNRVATKAITKYLKTKSTFLLNP